MGSNNKLILGWEVLGIKISNKILSSYSLIVLSTRRTLILCCKLAGNTIGNYDNHDVTHLL